MGPSWIRRHRSLLAVGALACAGWLGACGGEAAEQPAAPAAAVDPSSDNVVTGPVNQARETAEAQEAHDRRLEQAANGQP
ncbi:MAG: hypothetical protein ACR2MO_03030 [Acidimicrobiales bacterium]